MAATRITCLTLLSLTAAIPTGDVGVRWIFPELKQYTFEMRSNISTGSMLPEEGATQTALHAKLIVQVFKDTRLQLVLDDVKITLHNNAKDSEHSNTPHDLPPESESLRKPWEAYYLPESGMLYEVQLSPEDPIWSANIKRALAVSLQLVRVNATDALYKKSYTVLEPCLHYNCKAEYSGLGTSVVRKLHGVPAFTRGYGRNVWLSVGTDVCDKDIKHPFVGSAERVYNVDGKGLSKFYLRSSLQYHTHNHILAVVTEMSLHRKLIAELETENSTEQANLITSFPTYQPHTFKDPTNTRAVTTQEQLMRTTRELLTRISEGIDRDNVVPDAEKIHSLDLIELHKTMSKLDLASLKSLNMELHVGTSYLNETNKCIFMEALPHVKSADAAKLIRYLIIEFTDQKFEDATALSLVRKLPFNIAQYSQDLLVQMEDLLNLSPDIPKEIRHASILSFATLAFNTYINQGCSTDEFEGYVQKYFRMYTDAQGYSDRLVWLQGLANLQVGSVAIYLESVILDLNLSRHERFLAMWTTMPIVRYTPERTAALYWPILTNSSEHIQLRVTALLLLLEAEKTAERVLSLHRYVESCEDEQLKNIWYTTVRSLEKSTYSCNAPLSRLISYVSKLLQPRDDMRGTGNHIIDKTDEDMAYSAMSQFITIAKPMTEFPEVVYLTFNSNQAGLLTNQISVMLKAEGVLLSFIKQLKSFTATKDIKSVADLLKNMKIELIKPEEVHIDLIINVQGKTVYTAHVNQSFDKWLSPDGSLLTTIMNLLPSEIHVNQQLVQYPLQIDINLPTELGTPVTLQTTWCSFMSLRGTMTSPISKPPEWRRKNDIHFRYRGTAVTSLTSFCPVLGSESAMRVQQSTVAHLPLKFDLEAAGKQLKAIWLNEDSTGGVAMHSRSQVSLSMIDGKDLKQYCPRCLSSHTIRVKEIDKEEGLPGIFFDCDRPMTRSEFLAKLLSSIQPKDYFSTPRPTLVWLHLLHLVSVPPSGACGLWLPSVYPVHLPPATSLRLQLSPFISDSGDGFTIQFGDERNKSTDGKSLSTLSGNILVNKTEEKQHISITVDVFNPKDNNTAQQRICIESIHERRILSIVNTWNYPAPYSGTVKMNYILMKPGKDCLEEGLMVEYARELKVNETTHEIFEKDFNAELTNKGSIAAQLLTELGPLRPFLQKIATEPLKLTIVERNGIADVRIGDGPSWQFRSQHLDRLLDSSSKAQIFGKLSINRECRIQDGNITTLAGTTEQLETTNCSEVLVLAECTQKPMFALSCLRDGSYKLYGGGTHVTIASVEGELVVQVNDEQLKHYPLIKEQFKITTVVGNRRVSYGNVIVVDIYRNSSEVVVQVSDWFVRTLCGACASHQYSLCP